ncbi:hypothetical protein O6072_01880 [Mycolicibacterium neoaurum]|uniref:hypothetical protein n=1 Tax=Mycolicibacterium neoaurum TaxID=1795 RepID=UPI00248B1B7D|nr:hypothetical protein [Mycolicibacterium neoaurum]WBS08660.1 hypothetical protein O6072_01880 [Mycolicibacterium neoaurum]
MAYVAAHPGVNTKNGWNQDDSSRSRRKHCSAVVRRHVVAEPPITVGVVLALIAVTLIARRVRKFLSEDSVNYIPPGPLRPAHSGAPTVSKITFWPGNLFT